eukprot:5371093-Pyramimonas_sp.AAC.1
MAKQQEDNLLWTRGLVRHPEADWTFIEIDEGGGARRGPLHGGHRVSRNARCGPLPRTPPVHRQVEKAEMWAFYKVLEHKLGDGKIYADHRGTIEGERKSG